MHCSLCAVYCIVLVFTRSAFTLPKPMDASTARPTALRAFSPVEQLATLSRQRLIDFSREYLSNITLYFSPHGSDITIAYGVLHIIWLFRCIDTITIADLLLYKIITISDICFDLKCMIVLWNVDNGITIGGIIVTVSANL